MTWRQLGIWLAKSINLKTNFQVQNQPMSLPKTPPEPARSNRRSNCAKHLSKSSKFELQKNRYLLTAVQFISCLPNFYNMKTQITTSIKVLIGLDIFHFFYFFLMKSGM